MRHEAHDMNFGFNGAECDAQTTLPWPEPSPLPSALPAVPEMPETLLPPTLRPWLCDTCERTQIPLDYTAAPAVVALSSLIGRTVRLYPKQQDDWLVVPNIWGVVVGRPGALKSPAMIEALKPLHRLAIKAEEHHKEAARHADARATVIQAKIDATKGDARAAAKDRDHSKLTAAESDLASLAEELEQAECHERRYLVNDGTVEKLGELLNRNPRGLLLMRDELVGLLRSLDKQGHETDRAFYLEAWAGNGAFTYDRIGRGTVHIPALTLSVIGGMTPGKLQSYIGGALSGGADDDGLLQRFQVAVWPDLGRDWRNVDRYPDTTAKNRAFEVFQALDELTPETIGAEITEDEIPGLRFAPDAQELFDEFRAQLERQIRCGEEAAPAFESHLAKYRSLMPSLALIFHLVEVVQSGNAGPVTLEAARLAATWCDYLKRHARRIYAAELYPDVTAAHLLAGKIAAGAISDEMHVREIYRPQWTGLTKPDAVWSGLERLRKHHFIRFTQKKTNGRPADVIEINPATKRKAA